MTVKEAREVVSGKLEFGNDDHILAVMISSHATELEDYAAMGLTSITKHEIENLDEDELIEYLEEQWSMDKNGDG